MPAALLPVLSLAARYGLRAAIVLLAMLAAWRSKQQIERDLQAEAALDRVEEGLELHHSSDELHGRARARRVIRFGKTGPGLDIDFSALARLRIRRV